MLSSTRDFGRNTVGFGSKAPAAIATPEAIATGPLWVSYIRIKAFRPTRAVNTGIVYLGITTANDTQVYGLGVGEVLELYADSGALIDASKIFVDAVTLTDGVVFSYVQPANLDL